MAVSRLHTTMETNRTSTTDRRRSGTNNLESVATEGAIDAAKKGKQRQNDFIQHQQAGGRAVSSKTSGSNRPTESRESQNQVSKKEITPKEGEIWIYNYQKAMFHDHNRTAKNRYYTVTCVDAEIIMVYKKTVDAVLVLPNGQKVLRRQINFRDLEPKR